MLKNGPYPLPLQQRVRSSRGHLSNEDAAEFLSTLVSEHLQVVVLAHLSETNNRPDLAVEAARTAVPQGHITALHLARQEKPVGLISLLKK